MELLKLKILLLIHGHLYKLKVEIKLIFNIKNI